MTAHVDHRNYLREFVPVSEATESRAGDPMGRGNSFDEKRTIRANRASGQQTVARQTEWPSPAARRRADESLLCYEESNRETETCRVLVLGVGNEVSAGFKQKPHRLVSPPIGADSFLFVS